MAAGAADLRTPAALALAAAIGLWPYMGTLGFGPMTLDAVHWIQRGGPESDARWDWIFSSAHFIAYRPVTALSFWLTGTFGGPDGWHRGFDLALHAINGCLVHGVARRVPGIGRSGALLAAAIFLWHPVGEEVVPWLARRSYGLATGFSLAALLLLSRSLAAGLDPAQLLRRSLAAAVCLLAAVLSNEVAFTAAAAFPAWAWLTAPAERREARALLRACAPGLAAAAGAVALRSLVIDGVGGYAPDTSAERFLAVFVGFWRDLVAFAPDYAAERSIARRLLLVCGGAGLLGSVAYSVFALARRRAAGRILGTLLGWLGFASLLLCAQNVWFTRELLPLLPIFALWLSLVLTDAWAYRRSFAVAPLLVLLALALHSPVLRGPDPVRTARWNQTQATLDDLTSALAAAPAPTWIGLGLDYTREQRQGSVRARAADQPPRFLRLAPTWLAPRHAAAGHRIQTLLALPGTSAQPAQATLFEAHGDVVLHAPAEQKIERFAGVPAPTASDESGQMLRLHSVARPPGMRSLFYLRVDGNGQFAALRPLRP